MTGIVIDASVTLSWCFPDEQTPMSLNVLDRLKSGERALAPAFWSRGSEHVATRRTQRSITPGTDESVFRHPASPKPGA